MVAPFRKSMLFALGLVTLLLPAAGAKFFVYDRSLEDPLDVARSYLQALQAQDHLEAYRHISAPDRQVASQADYTAGHRSLSGFALQLAKIIAAQTEFRVVEREIKGERARLTLDYKAPAADELSALLPSWDNDKANALSRAQQRRMIGVLEKMSKRRSVITTEGRKHSIWSTRTAAGKFSSTGRRECRCLSTRRYRPTAPSRWTCSKRKLFVGTDEPFQTSLKLKNRSRHEVMARIEHRIEPKEYAGHLAMIACGFLGPLTLQPGEEREVPSAYLLDPGLPKKTAFRMTFEFNLASASRPASVNKTNADAGR